MLFFEVKEWDYNTLDKKAYFKKGSKTNKICKTFPFKSDLKRMSTITFWQDSKVNSYRCLTKGAPEVLEKFLVKKPDNYEAAYKYYTK